MATQSDQAQNQPTSAPKQSFKIVPFEDLDHALFKKNVKALKKLNESLIENLEAIKEVRSELIQYEDGEYDIHFQGAFLYKMGHETYAKHRVENYQQKDGFRRVHLTPLDSANLDDESNEIAVRIMRRAVEAGIEFTTMPTRDFAFHTLMLGIGLGSHLPLLLELNNTRNLIMQEPNAEFLYWSCFVFDWDAFLKDCRKNRRTVRLMAYETPDLIRDYCVAYVRNENPAYVDGLLMFETYPNSVMHLATEMMMSNADLFNIGLGFLEDEIDMMRNSYRNMENFDGRYFKRMATDMTYLPVFVVGAGPSLDSDLEFLRKNQDKAIVLSCGTALGILLKNGIRPDFQMEMENVPAVTRLMTTLSQKHDLSGITLVASSTADPGVQTFFDETVFYFRASLSSYSIFNLGEDTGLIFSTPTVTNLGLAFAQELGSHNIYLFGMDLGARDNTKHHAKDAVYNTGELEFTTKIDKPTPGNFGGQVYSEKVYMWAKTTAEGAIDRYPARTYINCSDGLQIDGTVPKLSSQIELQERPEKRDTVDYMMSRFPPYTREHFEKSWDGEKVREDIRTYAKSLLRETQKSTSEHRRGENIHDLEFLFKIVRKIIIEGSVDPAEVHFMRGSSLMLMTFINYYYERIPDDENRAIYADIARDEFAYMIRWVRDMVLELYDYIEGKTPQDGKFEAREPDETA